MYSQFSEQAKNCVKDAQRIAASLYQGYIGTEHLLAALAKDSSGLPYRVLQTNGVEYTKLMEMIGDSISFGGKVELREKYYFSPRARRVIDEAHRLADRFGADRTQTGHLLLALIKEGENVAVRLLGTLGVNLPQVYAQTLRGMGLDGELYKTDLAPKGRSKEIRYFAPTWARSERLTVDILIQAYLKGTVIYMDSALMGRYFI